jgi:hypothetical protein
LAPQADAVPMQSPEVGAPQPSTSEQLLPLGEQIWVGVPVH